MSLIQSKKRHKHMKHIFLSIALLYLSSFGIQAQQKDSTVNKSITITRKYQPNIYHSNKIISIPKKEKVKVYKPTPQYLNIATSMDVSYHIQTLKANILRFKQKKYYNEGLVRIGFGNPLNTLADIIAPIYNSENSKINLTLNHLGTFQNKKYSNTNFNLRYDYLFSNSRMFFNLGFEHDFFNYYGDVFRNNSILKDATPYYNTIYTTDNAKKTQLKQLYQLKKRDNHFRINPKIGFRSLSLTENLTLNTDLSYKMFYSYTNEITEHQSYIKSLLKQKLNDNLLGLQLDVFNFIYNSNYNDFNISNNDYLNYSLIKLNPYYKINRENWFVKLGVKTSISISAGKSFSPSPDIEFQWNIIPEYLSLAGAVTGDVTINSLDKIYKENRYLSPQNRVEDTYSPIDSYLNITISPIDNFIFDIFGEFKIISNPYFYTNKRYLKKGGDFFHNRFDVIVENSDVQKIAFGLNFAWNYLNKASIYAKTKYNHWTLDKEKYAWHLPKWETKIGTNIRLTNNLEINSQFTFEDGRYALLSNPKGVKINPIFDWNISGTYTYSEKLSFFLQINNILNQKYQLLNGYNNQGFNTIIGTAFYF